MKLKRIGLIVCLVACVLGNSGCNQVEESWAPVSADNTIKIAIIGDDEFITDSGTMEAMEMASADFCQKTGIQIKIEIYDDDSDYNKGIECAKEITEDESVMAVIVKQELDYIDTTAELFEEAGKPFIITNGCYESTIDKSYEYMLVDCISAEAAGNIMAQYVMENGYKKVAFCHSNTKYEEDELKGFQSELSSDVSCLIDTMVGPYSLEQFNDAYARWETLGVDVVCISNYDILNSDLVAMLRKKGSDIQVVGDYVMDTEEDIKVNGRYLEGTAIVAMYVNDFEANNTEITDRFETQYEMEMSEKAMQSYDVIYMLGEVLHSGITEPGQVVQTLKESEGYKGISGTLKFDERGCLIPNGNEILVYKNGVFAQ